MIERNEDERKIEALLAQVETRKVEFKSAEESFKLDKAIDYSVAIANERGGELVLGITDTVPRSVCGTLAFPDLANLEQRIHEAVKLNVVAREIRTPAGRVVILQIPSRRRGVPVHHNGKYLVRRGESLTAMEHEALAAIFAESKDREETIAAAADLTSDDVFDLLDVDAYFRLLAESQPATRDGRLGRLAQRRLLRSDGDRWTVLNAGALFLARDLQDFPKLAMRAARVLKYDGLGRLNARLDHFENRGYGISFESIVETVSAQLPTLEIIEAGRRKDIPMHAPRAVREFVANALVHQDLEETSTQPTIEIFDDRLEVRNPGLPIIDVNRFVDETNQRSPDLAEAMRLAGHAERRGSGVDRALEQIESLIQRAPEFTLHRASTSVIMRGPVDVAEMTDDEKIRTTYQHCCLRHEQRERLTNGSLRQRLNLPDARAWQVSGMISATVDAGLIKLDPRSGKSRKYAAYLPFFALD